MTVKALTNVQHRHQLCVVYKKCKTTDTVNYNNALIRKLAMRTLKLAGTHNLISAIWNP